MSSGQQQTLTLQSSPLPTATPTPKRRSMPRRSSSGLLKKPTTDQLVGSGGETAAALPVKRRGSYQQLKKSMAGREGADGGEGAHAVLEVGSLESAEQVQVLSSPEFKQSHWEQFGTAQVFLLPVNGNEEVLSFYDQALSAEGYDVLSVEDVDELSSVLQNSKVDPDLLLLLCTTFGDEEAQVVEKVRCVNGHLPVLVIGSSESRNQRALKCAQGYLQQSDDIDELVANINIQLKRRHQAKLQVENMIEHAQKLLTHASLKRSILFTLAEEGDEEEAEQFHESSLLGQRQQIQQVLNYDHHLRNQAASLLHIIDRDQWTSDALRQDRQLRCDLLALKQIIL